MKDDVAAQVRAILWPPAQERVGPDGHVCKVRFDAVSELGGVLIDLRRSGADPICIRTIERVQEAICRVRKIVDLKG